jgi:hypothetical protein
MRGELHELHVVHWEAPAFRAMFRGNITPSDFDGWLGFVDCAGGAGGPLVIFEFKRGWANDKNGQAEAFRQLRQHLRTTDWWVRVCHDNDEAVGGICHVMPHHVMSWRAYRCGSLEPQAAQGAGVGTLAEFVSGLDPFGVRVVAS